MSKKRSLDELEQKKSKSIGSNKRVKGSKKISNNQSIIQFFGKPKDKSQDKIEKEKEQKGTEDKDQQEK